MITNCEISVSFLCKLSSCRIYFKNNLLQIKHEMIFMKKKSCIFASDYPGFFKFLVLLVFKSGYKYIYIPNQFLITERVLES